MSFLVSRQGKLILSFILQYQPNWQWCSDLCRLLYLMHFASWILHEKIAWSYFQQFLHWDMPRFIFIPLIVAIYFPTLKYWLIRLLALLLLWTSQISTQMINISNLDETLITYSFEVSTILLKIWFCFIISSTSLDKRCFWGLSWE